MICLTLQSPTLGLALGEITANKDNIDIAELRLDLLKPEEMRKASLFPSMTGLPVICTLRREQDGGQCALSEEEREEILLDALEGGFAYVDVESDIKDSRVAEKARERGIKVIRSLHDFQGLPEDIKGTFQALKAEGDVAKLAVTPHSVSDVLRLLKAADELQDMPKIVVAMGEYGVPVRVLYRRFGSLLSFAAAGKAVAPGQLTASDMRKVYRADRLTRETRIFGIIGNPVLHSSSPLIHNPGFDALGIDAVYVPFPTDNVKEFFKLAEYLGIGGFSVTIPYKTAVMGFLDELSPEVAEIGSCNTVVRTEKGWKGSNSDYSGFIRPIQKDIDSGRVRSALVVGAGGASNAVVWALCHSGVKVTVLNRTVEKAADIARVNHCAYGPMSELKDYEGKVDLVVNTTSVGLYPRTEGNPLEGFSFTGREIAYDIIYKPKMTRFLKEAEAAGCELRFGQVMLLEQGKAQFERFTGSLYPDYLQPELS